MDDEQFDTVSRHLGAGITRRGVLGVLAGVTGLGLSEVAGKTKKQRKQRTRKRAKKGRVSAEVKHGTLDGDAHPYVGLMVAQDENGKALWRCSGTLVSSTLFLTAGHCTEDPAEHVEIWFDADVESGIPANGYPNDGDVGGTPHTHPQYDPDAFYLYDLGVVVLDEPVEMPAYGQLPEPSQLDTLTNNRRGQKPTFTAVGYGLQKAFPDAASWKDQDDRIRMVAHPRLIQINTRNTGDYSLLLSNNANTGGTCFGDSGGPNFIGDTTVIAGVTSYARNATCAGSGGVYRVDQADDLAWLYGAFGDQLP